MVMIVSQWCFSLSSLLKLSSKFTKQCRALPNASDSSLLSSKFTGTETGIIIHRFLANMTSPTADKSSCIFCNIVNKFENTEILFDDEYVCCFRDIKPASDFHILTVPKRHIEDVKCLTPEDKELVQHMLTAAKDLLVKKNLSVDDARFGYHWPPFRSVRHLHLHTIAPEAQIGFIGRMIFKKNSYWFVSPEYVESRL